MTLINAKNLFVRYSFESKGMSKAMSINALNGVSFVVNSGENIGVIGPNGSGKSTLLKVLSGVLPTSKGELKISGDVLSLIDRTTGLIRKATLAENARLKAYSLGLSSEEADSFITESLRQAGLEKRADFPMNSLSTGMTAKFNIAINSQIFKPITILDEWVGTLDSSQTGAGSIMDRLANSADILILASHNEALIRELCSKVILLNKGDLDYYGDDLDLAFKRLNKLKHFTDTNNIISSSASSKEKINVLCLPKSGGYLLKKILSNIVSEQYDFVLHKVDTKLEDIPVGQKVVFFVRNPVEKFARAFYMRFNQGAPFYNSKWNSNEASAFESFKSSKKLAEGLSHKNVSIRTKAILSLNQIAYLTTLISDYLGDLKEVEMRTKDIAFVGNADKMLDELERFKNAFNLDIDLNRIINKHEELHFSSSFSDEITNEGKLNLYSLYEQDIDYYKNLISNF